MPNFVSTASPGPVIFLVVLFDPSFFQSYISHRPLHLAVDPIRIYLLCGHPNDTGEWQITDGKRTPTARDHDQTRLDWLNAGVVSPSVVLSV